MIKEISYALFLALVLMMLGPLASVVIRKRDIKIERSLKIFVGIAIFRLLAVGIFSYFVIKNGGNLFVFLITFATVYSVLLIPEILSIGKILEKN